MKPSLVRCALLFAIVNLVMNFSPQAFGDETSDMLNKAIDLVHQAWNPGGDPPPNDQREDLLKQALKIAQETPDHRLKRHRVQAMLDIKAALAELDKGDPDHKATELIHDANTELRDALAIAQ